jgi:hypothetical protein
LDELVGQVINYEIGKRHKKEWIEEIIRTTKPGSIYYGNAADDFCEWIRDLQDEACSVPTMYVADVEHGPGCGAPVPELLPVPMAWGAVNDPDLLKTVQSPKWADIKKRLTTVDGKIVDKETGLFVDGVEIEHKEAKFEVKAGV